MIALALAMFGMGSVVGFMLGLVVGGLMVVRKAKAER